MPISRTPLSREEQSRLLLHLQKHKVYPYRFAFQRAISAIAGGTFSTLDAGGGGSYFSIPFTPNTDTGVISIASGFTIYPNTTVGRFSLLISYNPIISLGDGANDEANVIYQLQSNGGSINDFQVFYPLNWFVERNKPIYIHMWADNATVGATTSSVQGHMTFGTLLTGL